MNEQITLTILLVVLLVGHLVIGGVCIYRMKRDWRRVVQVQQTFTVGDVATMEQVCKMTHRSLAYGHEAGPELFVPSTQMPRNPPDPEVV